MQRCKTFSVLALLMLSTGLSAVQIPTLPAEKSETDPLIKPPPELSPEDRLLTVGEALDLARNAIDRLVDSDDPAVRKKAGADLDRGLAVIRTKDPNHPWLPYLYAFVHLREGRSWDAVDQLQKFVNTRDGRNEWKAYRTLGNIVVDSFPRLARSHFLKAAALKEGEPSVLYGLSRCAANIGDYAEALDYAEQAVTADRRKSIKYLTHLAHIAQIRKEWSTATSAANDALAAAKQKVAARGGSFKLLSNVEAQYKLLIEIESARLQDVRDVAELARGYMQLADYARGRSEIVVEMTKYDITGILQAGVDRLGDDAPTELLVQTVIALTNVGNHDDAAALCHRILEKEPGNAFATEWLSQHGNATSDASE